MLSGERCYSETYSRWWLQFIFAHSVSSIFLHSLSLWLAVLLAALRLRVIRRAQHLQVSNYLRACTLITDDESANCVIAGLDARGFILGPPIALAMKKPFVMMRKGGKMPNTIKSEEYDTEYGSRSGLTVQRDKIKKGDRVLIIDDLVATGGTLSSAIALVKMLDATVVECACVVELKCFVNPPEDSGMPNRTKLFDKL